jgi:hypothetical protein
MEDIFAGLIKHAIVCLLLVTTEDTPKCDYLSPRGKKIVGEVFGRFKAAPIDRSDIARIARDGITVI